MKIPACVSVVVGAAHLLGVPVAAQAQTTVGLQTGVDRNAVARLEFQIVIPRVMFLRVNADTASATGTTNRGQAVPWTATVSNPSHVVYTAALP